MIVMQAVHKLLRDLDSADTKGEQIFKGGIAGAEVVDRNSTPSARNRLPLPPSLCHFVEPSLPHPQPMPHAPFCVDPWVVEDLTRFKAGDKIERSIRGLALHVESHCRRSHQLSTPDNPPRTFDRAGSFGASRQIREGASDRGSLVMTHSCPVRTSGVYGYLTVVRGSGLARVRASRAAPSPLNDSPTADSRPAPSIQIMRRASVSSFQRRTTSSFRSALA
jgi:hypothetical protein